MNRRGVALAAALLVVLLGGILVASSVTWATVELRAGSAWSAQARADAASTRVLIDQLPALHAWLDSSAIGDTLAVAADSGGQSRIYATILNDSLLLLQSHARYRDSEARIGVILRLTSDSAGLRPFGFAPRYHPLP